MGIIELMVSSDSRSTGDMASHDSNGQMGAEATRVVLRSAGLRCTPQRLAIYEALCRSSHPTAEELHATVTEGTPVSLATVYNTLDAFCSAGIILRLPSRSGVCRYCGENKAHLHLRIEGRDELLDVPPDLGGQILDSLSPEILASIESRMGVRINGIDIQLSGAREADA